MRITLYTGCISPHQLPLSRELVARVGADNFRYIYTDQQGMSADRQKLGWSIEDAPWLMSASNPATKDWIENAEVLICSFRDTALIERRCLKNLKTFYTNERWFKPPIGRLRMLVPSFRRMIERLVSLCRQYDCFRMLPIGIYAYTDYKWAGVPESKMTIWGYFVAPSTYNKSDKIHCPPSTSTSSLPLRVLWVGRMLKLKNVDVLIKAVIRANAQATSPSLHFYTAETSPCSTCSPRPKYTLTIVGDGPEKSHLQKLASTVHLQPLPITFSPPVPIDKVRELMREHDVFVFPSNGYEGWGAVVSEALEEGMFVLGSNQSGASATILPPSHRFDCRDVNRLSNLLSEAHNGKLESIAIGDWSVSAAATRLLKEVEYAF